MITQLPPDTHLTPRLDRYPVGVAQGLSERDPKVTATSLVDDALRPRAGGRRVRPHLLLELALIAVAYETYAHVRDLHGRSGGSGALNVALHHGRDVMRPTRPSPSTRCISGHG